MGKMQVEGNKDDGNIMKSCNNPDFVLVKTTIKSLRFGDEALYNYWFPLNNGRMNGKKENSCAYLLTIENMQWSE